MQIGADQGARGRTKPIGLAGTEPASLRVISTSFSPAQPQTWRQIYRQDYSDLDFGRNCSQAFTWLMKDLRW